MYRDRRCKTRGSVSVRNEHKKVSPILCTLLWSCNDRGRQTSRYIETDARRIIESTSMVCLVSCLQLLPTPIRAQRDRSCTEKQLFIRISMFNFSHHVFFRLFVGDGVCVCWPTAEGGRYSEVVINCSDRIRLVSARCTPHMLLAVWSWHFVELKPYPCSPSTPVRGAHLPRNASNDCHSGPSP